MKTKDDDRITVEGELYESPRNTLDFLAMRPPAPGHSVPLADGLRWARLPLPMELNHINVWLMRDGGGWLLIDTGLAHDVCREAWLVLDAGTLDGRPLRRLFVTHDHPDHIGLAHWLQQRHGAPLWMSSVGHESTAQVLEAAATGDLGNRRNAFLATHGMELPPETSQRIEASRPGRWLGELPSLDRAITDGDRVVVDDREWEVIETSGHCRGHLCLYDARNEILISGDQVLPTISPNVSVLSARPDANPLGEFLESLTRLGRCAPGTLVLPSHGRPFRGLHGRLEALRSHHLQQLETLRQACEGPRSARSLVEVMFGRPLRGFHQVLALGETVAHLNCLWHAGSVERRVDDAGRITFAGK